MILLLQPTTTFASIRPILALLICLVGGLKEAVATSPATVRNYAYLYYRHGHPTPLNHRRPASMANFAARANPDLVFQTGYYSILLDCDSISLKGYDALAGTDYRSALDTSVTVFTPASQFLLRVTQGGVNYTCTGALVQASGVDNVRLIESGQYMKRIDHMGLIFKDAQGNTLNVDANCRLEVSAWPDRITFMLDFSSETVNPITRTTIQIISPNGVAHLSDTMTNKGHLSLQPQADVKLGALNAADYVTTATNLQNNSALSVGFDADTHAFDIEVPAGGVNYPSAVNRVDEYLIEVTNPLSEATNVPLRFIQPSPRAITGTVMFLCDADSGRPLGIPVQISKNWHTNISTVHQGSWLRGSTLLTLQAGASQRFKLRVVYGYWGGAGTVSHAQLSLIGWSKNWKWDESALGAWGESMTYDPTGHAGAAFIDDVRPAFTHSYHNSSSYKDGDTVDTTHDWTENIGGGDFLVYYDSANTFRHLKQIKTCYYQTGPNLTEVFYSGVTDDDKIRVTYTSRAVATLDYHRRFHAYKYEFLQDVISPQRLVFHQMAADNYVTNRYSNFYVGNAGGLLSTVNIHDVENPIAGGNTYRGSPIAIDGKWLSIDDTTGSGTSYQARALRGLIPLRSTLNGSSFPLYVHKYGSNSSGGTVLFDFSANTVNRSYTAGDVVAGEIEFILPPKQRDDYWGSDAELIARLNAYGNSTWEPVRDELVENTMMSVSLHQGTLLNNYPLEIQSTSGRRVLADLTINNGGIGYIPVVLRGADTGLELKLQRYISGAWVNLESVDIDNDRYYQAVQNANGTMDYAFNVPRPSSAYDLDTPWRFRILYANFPRIDTPVQESLNLAAANELGLRGYLYRGDDKFMKHPDSAWTVSNGTFSNNSTDDSRGGEGALAQIIPANSLAASTGNLLTLSFNYTLNDPDELLYVHLWGLVGSMDTSSKIMNLAATNGSAWYVANEGILAYNLADGLAAQGSASRAAVIVTNTTGPQTHSTILDLSAYDSAINDLSDFDYIVIGLARQIGGVSAPGVQVSNLRLSVNTKGPDELPFEKWTSDYGLTSSDATADPDADGLTNFREFALGGHPGLAGSTGYQPFQRKVLDGGSEFLEFVFRRRIAAENALNYRLQTRTDLSEGSWLNSGFVELPAVATEDADFEEVIGRIDTNSAPKAFIRLLIETPE